MTLIVDIIKGAISLLAGMWVTLKAFVSPVVTVQYPREVIEITPRFRGHIKLVADPENPDRTACFACGACGRACPSNCIKHVEGEKREGEKKKSVTSYMLDFTMCSQCGLCVESCPVGAIAFSADYNPVGFHREDFCYDLVREFEVRKAG